MPDVALVELPPKKPVGVKGVRPHHSSDSSRWYDVGSVPYLACQARQRFLQPGKWYAQRSIRTLGNEVSNRNGHVNDRM